ncbi:hypothetical protein KAH55_03830 [bacterium]|nr:hypothetical protein [bacterium]
MSKETEPITPLPYITKTQMIEMMRDLFQEIPTKTDFEQLKETVSTSQNSTEKTTPQFRSAIEENERAVDTLYRDMASNKNVLNSLKLQVTSMREEIVSLNRQISGYQEGLTTTSENSTIPGLDELVHNVEANTRVIGKVAQVAASIHAQLDEVLTRDDLFEFRNDMITRLDGLAHQIEIFSQEQSAIRVGLKRVEKMQKDEMVRNDQQDASLMQHQAKVQRLETKLRKVVGM